jgi:hypothetical protein
MISLLAQGSLGQKEAIQQEMAILHPAHFLLFLKMGKSVLLPLGFFLCEDEESGYINLALYRGSELKYAYKRLIAAAISAMITVLIACVYGIYDTLAEPITVRPFHTY